jgi:hypothetical protein
MKVLVSFLGDDKELIGIIFLYHDTCGEMVQVAVIQAAETTVWLVSSFI